ncbi:MAG: hypothetical protein HY057_12245 [Rhodospirillales bacterium]|nr:hypothetical protein [Rhodospirillales bacterium]
MDLRAIASDLAANGGAASAARRIEGAIEAYEARLASDMARAANRGPQGMPPRHVPAESVPASFIERSQPERDR